MLPSLWNRLRNKGVIFSYCESVTGVFGGGYIYYDIGISCHGLICRV